MSDPLKNISPLDGRYSKSIETLSDYFSESALIKYRIKVEIEYLIHLSRQKEVKELDPISDKDIKKLEPISAEINDDNWAAVKTADHLIKSFCFAYKVLCHRACVVPYPRWSAPSPPGGSASAL